MKNFKNPIMLNDSANWGKTSDPYVLYYEGYYYHCYMAKEGIYISCSEQLCDIGSAEGVKVIDSKECGFTDWYAPELHRINNGWYIYASPEYNNGLHIMTVLECKDESPLGVYTNLGRIRGLENTFSIDGTILEYNDNLYLVYACGSVKSLHLNIARMSDPYTIVGEAVELSKPEYTFETKQGLVNEGPAILKRGNKIHIVYSANDSKTDDYCLGMLTFSGGDIMNLENWYKSSDAVFERTENIFGPGHCSFTVVSENNEKKDYILYHANLISGSGWFGRNIFAQSFTWDEDNMPLFGKPVMC